MRKVDCATLACIPAQFQIYVYVQVLLASLTSQMTQLQKLIFHSKDFIFYNNYYIIFWHVRLIVSTIWNVQSHDSHLRRQCKWLAQQIKTSIERARCCKVSKIIIKLSNSTWHWWWSCAQQCNTTGSCDVSWYTYIHCFHQENMLDYTCSYSVKKY